MKTLFKQKRLRDEIAIGALQAIIAKHKPMTCMSGEDADKRAERAARGAYRYADAMLKVRKGV